MVFILLSILFVDDEPVLRTAGKAYLERIGGFAVETADSANAALAQIAKKSYDAIVSDYMMPGMDGITLLKSVRAMDPDIPFVLVTGHGDEEIAIEAINSGVTGYIRKDGKTITRLAELTHTLRKVVEERKAKEALLHAHDTLKRQARDLAILNELISTANHAGNLRDLVERFLDRLLTLLDFDAGDIILIDADGKTLLIHSKNMAGESPHEPGAAASLPPPYDIQDTRAKPVISGQYDKISPEHSATYGFFSFAGIPLLSHGRVIGELNVFSKKRHAISEQENQTLVSVGLELGSAVERMIAEEDVKRSAENFEALLVSMDEMVFVLDMQGRILWVNDAVVRHLHYDRDKLITMPVADLHVPERKEEAGQIVQAMIAGTTDSCPVPVCTKEGSRLDVETKITRGFWNGREVLIGVSRDITSTKKA